MSRDKRLSAGAMKTLIVLMGPPGSGKSRAVEGRCVVTTDAVRQGHDLDATYGGAYQRLRHELHRNSEVIFDSMGTAPTRAHLLRIAGWEKVRTRLVVFDTPLDVCLERQCGRTDPVPDEAVVHWHAELMGDWPRLDAEGWDEVEHR